MLMPTNKCVLYRAHVIKINDEWVKISDLYESQVPRASRFSSVLGPRLIEKNIKKLKVVHVRNSLVSKARQGKGVAGR